MESDDDEFKMLVELLLEEGEGDFENLQVMELEFVEIDEIEDDDLEILMEII